MQHFYAAVDGATMGPLDASEAHRLYCEGVIAGETLIWDEATKSWIDASKHPAFSSIIRETAGRGDTGDDDGMTAENEGLSRERSILAGEIERLKEKRSVLAAEMEALEEKGSSMRAEMEEMKAARDEVAADAASMEKKRSEMDGFIGSLRSELEALARQRDELGRMKEGLIRDIRTLEEKKRRAKDASAESAGAARAADEAREKAGKELAALRKEIDELSTRKGEIEEEIRSLTEAEREAEARAFREIEGRLETSSGIIRELEGLKENLEATIGGISKDAEERLESIEEAAREILGRDEKLREAAALSMDSVLLEEDIRGLTDKKRLIEESCERSARELERMNETIKAATSERDKLLGEISELQTLWKSEREETSALREAIDKAEGELVERRGRLSILRREIEASEAEFDSLAGRKERLSEDIDSLRTSAEEIRRAIEDEEERIREKRREAEGIERETREASSAREALQADAERLAAEIERLRNEREEIVSGTASIAAARSEAEAALNAANAALASAREDLDSINERKALIEEETGRLGKESERIRGEIEAGEVRKGVLEREVSLLVARVDSMGDEIERLAGVTADRKTEYAEMERDLKRMEDNLIQVREDTRIAEESRAEIEARIRAIDAELARREAEFLRLSTADLDELRRLLAEKEHETGNRLDALIQEGRIEFERLKEDWQKEETGRPSDEDLSALHHEVEEKRNDLAKLERKMSALRAGVLQLREENSRNILDRVKRFEEEGLEALKRRLREVRTEMAALDRSMETESRQGSKVEERWIEVESTARKMEREMEAL